VRHTIKLSSGQRLKIEGQPKAVRSSDASPSHDCNLRDINTPNPRTMNAQAETAALVHADGSS
jgi:hypothetical protein